MLKRTVIFVIGLFLTFYNPTIVRGEYLFVQPSAQIKKDLSVNSFYDQRSFKLRAFLNEYNSPLSDFSDEFIYASDKYGLDYRFIPAITGVESTFGKRIPVNSYNAYGWNNGNYYFESWEDSIDHVSKTLKEKYIDRGLVDIYQIASVYAPPSSTWAYKVNYFMNKIDPISIEFDL